MNYLERNLKMPFFAGPVGAVNLHCSDGYDGVSCNNVLWYQLLQMWNRHRRME